MYWIPTNCRIWLEDSIDAVLNRSILGCDSIYSETTECIKTTLSISLPNPRTKITGLLIQNVFTNSLKQNESDGYQMANLEAYHFQQKHNHCICRTGLKKLLCHKKDFRLVSLEPFRLEIMGSTNKLLAFSHSGLWHLYILVGGDSASIIRRQFVFNDKSKQWKKQFYLRSRNIATEKRYVYLGIIQISKLTMNDKKKASYDKGRKTSFSLHKYGVNPLASTELWLKIIIPTVLYEC